MGPAMTRLRHAVIPFAVAFFALALQVQVTLFEAPGYNGIRLCFADLALPPAFIVIVFSWISGKARLPSWSPPFGYFWIFLLTGVMTYALLRFYVMHGDVNSWALTNKYAGWFALMAYLGIGAWLGQNYGDDTIRKFPYPFTLLLITSSAVISFVTIYGYYDRSIVAWTSWLINFDQLEGLMGNRNAFAFLLGASALLVPLFSVRHPELLPRRLVCLYWALLPLFLIMNGSRALWVAIIPIMGLALWIARGKTIKQMLLCTAAGIFIVMAIYPANLTLNASNRVVALTNVQDLAASEQDTTLQKRMHQSGDDVRIRMLTLAYTVWQTHPFLGAGLGAIIEMQKEDPLRILTVIDNTPLWILAEAGIAGFSAFAAAFIAILLALFRILKSEEPWVTDEKRTMAIFCFALLIFFGFFSLLHEILYTRFLWFFLGLTLAAPLKTHQNG